MIQDNTTTTKPLLSFDFTDSEGEQQQLFMEEVGTLVFQSALIRYLASESEQTAREFEVFINLHVASETFIEVLCDKYPSFKEILETEMNAFRSEVNSLN
jgi:hypothetical protein